MPLFARAADLVVSFSPLTPLHLSAVPWPDPDDDEIWRLGDVELAARNLARANSHLAHGDMIRLGISRQESLGAKHGP